MAIGVTVLGVVVTIVAALALKDFLLISSYAKRLQHDPDAKGNWELSYSVWIP